MKEKLNKIKEDKLKMERIKQIDKRSKTNKIISCVVILIIAALVINFFIMGNNSDYAYFFVKNIIAKFDSFLFYVEGNIKYFSFIKLAVYLLLILICCIVMIYYTYFSKKEISFCNKIVNIGNSITMIILLVISVPLLNTMAHCYMPNFDQLYFNETKDKTYTSDDLTRLSYYLQEKVSSYASKVDRKDGTVVFNDDYIETATKDLKNISNKIDLLKGLYPTKSGKMNNLLKSLYGSDMVGLTQGYNTYFDYNMDPVNVLTVVTHEFCHSKSITRENETVFCQSIAGINSDNIVSQYSGYLEAFTRTITALESINYDLANQIEDSIISKCMTKGYSEFCDSYVKNVDEYIKGADTIYLTTYYLSAYKDNKDELIDSIKVLNENGAKYSDKDNNSISYQELVNLINSNTDERIYIEIDDFNSKIFKNIKDKLNKKLYLSIYQENRETEVSEEQIDNPTKYYLEPFDTNDYKFYNFINYASVDYTYERSARLFLEYFEKYGY